MQTTVADRRGPIDFLFFYFSKNYSPSAPQTTLDEQMFVESLYVECLSPSVTLSKVFAKCILPFAEC
jgi:hypothetical protein